MLKITELKDVRTVNIEGRQFFGMYNKTKDGAAIVNSMDITGKSINKELFLEYILAENVGNLNKKLTIEGAYVAAIQELNDTEMFDFTETLRKALHHAAKATKAVQNKYVEENL